MAEPQTRAKPPQLNARARRAAAQLAAARKYQRGEAPSEPVNAALQGFSGPPSPEQIAQVSMQLAQQYGVAAAIEFETYARSALADKAAPAARQAAATNQAPPAEVQAALHSFKEAPTDEQIQAKTAELAQRSPELAASFRAYAEQLRSDRMAAEEANLSPEHQGMVKEREARPIQQPTPTVPGMTGPSAPPPRQGTTVAEPAKGEPGYWDKKIQDAKDILQGTASVLTLGYVKAPESIKRGNQELFRRVGLEKEGPVGRTE